MLRQHLSQSEMAALHRHERVEVIDAAIFVGIARRTLALQNDGHVLERLLLPPRDVRDDVAYRPLPRDVRDHQLLTREPGIRLLELLPRLVELLQHLLRVHRSVSGVASPKNSIRLLTSHAL